jgi:ribosomal protection tetracycline resistance protein
LQHSTLNLGILAHVDAGKTTLTERLLYAAGAIDEIGSVDAGTTQTDTLSLERQRGITIRSAVASFVVDGVTVNLIDTPGHPDFIAEVERVLRVLDGAVLVVSAVEGVQPQTRVLMAALRRLGVPTLLFVNKVDRLGADTGRVLDELRGRLVQDIVSMGRVLGEGERAARVAAYSAGDADFAVRLTDVLSSHDDSLLRLFVEDEQGVGYPRLRVELARQTARGLVHPVFMGSAATGAGVPALMAGLVELLPGAAGDVDARPSGRVFKIERGPAGDKVAYVRLFAGTVALRDRLETAAGEERVTGIRVYDHGAWVTRRAVRAGEIAQLAGLTRVRVGDQLGAVGEAVSEQHFPPPTLETVVVPRRARDRGALRVALGQLAEQDPLIDVRQDDLRQELTVSLYGEVQKEVIEATIRSTYGLDVGFRESTVRCVERLRGVGEAVERLHTETNPFNAVLGIRVEPAPPDTGLHFRLDIGPSDAPLYIYKNMAGFSAAMEETVRRALQEGLFGWEVVDCRVSVTECVYSSADGPPSARGPLSTSADFRKLTTLLVMRALDCAGTVVCEPVLAASLELPATAAGGVLAALARLGARVRGQVTQAQEATIHADLPAGRLRELQRLLPPLTGGEHHLATSFARYVPTSETPPVRPRTTPDPRNLDEYVAAVGR